MDDLELDVPNLHRPAQGCKIEIYRFNDKHCIGKMWGPGLQNLEIHLKMLSLELVKVQGSTPTKCPKHPKTVRPTFYV